MVNFKCKLVANVASPSKGFNVWECFYKIKQLPATNLFLKLGCLQKSEKKQHIAYHLNQR